jgi:predicted Zn-dependent protease
MHQPDGGKSSLTRRIKAICLLLTIIGLGFFYDQYLHTPAVDEQLQLAEQVERVVRRLAAESELVRQANPFTLRILDAAEVPAAFIMPSGRIYITRGLLDYLETEQQVAAVLAHEMAHSIAGHFDAAHLSQAPPGFNLQFDLDSEQGWIQGLEFDQMAELQADLLGMCILAQAGYDPLVMVDLMDILEAASQAREAAAQNSAAGDPVNSASHPSPEVRRGHLLNSLAQIEHCYP